MNTAYIIDAVRTPIGMYNGGLANMRPDELLAYIISALLQRNSNIDVRAIEQVIAGNAFPSYPAGANIARAAALLAGLPSGIACTTVNSAAASGMDAVIAATHALRCGDGLMYIAGGVECFSHALTKAENKHTTFPTDIYHATTEQVAENIAQQWNISREAQDAFTLQSHLKYKAAQHAGKWEDEIVPVETSNEGLISWFANDELPRNSNNEFQAAQAPVSKPTGTITADNSSAMADGAAVLLLASEEAIRLFDLQPVAKIFSIAVAGVDAAIMGMAPVPATRKALQRAGLKTGDLDLIEINESFAAEAIAIAKELDLEAQKINVNGGAIAMGHPPGCTGARILTTLMYEMLRCGAKYTLATTSGGTGHGAAIILEKV